MRILKILVILLYYVQHQKVILLSLEQRKAKAMLDRAVNLMKFNELFALEQMTEGAEVLKLKDLYPLCVNAKGILVGHPVNVDLTYLNL